jgi:hypothetical protein
MSNLFPKVSQSIKQTQTDDKLKEEFKQYLWNIDYHLSHAKDASFDCSEKLWHFDWDINANSQEISFRDLRQYVISIIRFGDIAIREAVSAIDTSLILVDYLLGLNVDKKKISWKNNPQNPKDKGQLQQAILRLDNNVGQGLYKAIDEVFKSIGYELLQGYRHWITHRGVPYFDSSDITIPITPSLQVKDEVEMRYQLLKKISSELRIKCYSFVPSVYESNNNLRLRIGNLSEDATQFKKNNSKSLETDTVEIAGEKLAVYSLSDYIHAVGEVVKFVEKSFTDKWDRELCDLCRQIALKNSSSLT